MSLMPNQGRILGSQLPDLLLRTSPIRPFLSFATVTVPIQATSTPARRLQQPLTQSAHLHPLRFTLNLISNVCHPGNEVQSLCCATSRLLLPLTSLPHLLPCAPAHPKFVPGQPCFPQTSPGPTPASLYLLFSLCLRCVPISTPSCPIMHPSNPSLRIQP